MADARLARPRLRRALAGAVTVTLLAGALGSSAATAAPPTLPACPAQYTDNPQRNNWEVEKPDGTTLFLLEAMPCVGTRLGTWEEPVLPARVELNRELVFEWEASCGTGRPAPCLDFWDTELQLYKRGQNGNLVQVPSNDAEGLYLDIRSQPECTGAGNLAVCQKMTLRSATGTIPRDLVALVGVTGRNMRDFGSDPDVSEYGLPWQWKAVPVVGPGSFKGLDVTLTAYGPGRGYSLDRMITIAQTQTVELTLTNEGDEPLTSLSFTGGQPLVVDPRSTGGLEIVSGPTPAIDPALTLAPGDEKTFTFEVEATDKGIAAAHSQVIALDPEGNEHKEGHSLKYEIEDGIEMTRNVGQWLRMQAMDQLLQETFGRAYASMVRRGEAVSARMAELFPPERRRQWFGSETGFPLSPTDFSIALLRGAAPEMVAALLPKEDIDGHTADELDQVYNETMWAELGKGGAKYVKGWTDLGAETQKFVKDSWAESMLTANYVLGSATPDERAQFEAYAMHLIDGTAADTNNLVNAVKKEIPKWRENGTYLVQALEETQRGGGIRGAMKTAVKLKEAYDSESAARDELLRLADTDPVAFQRQWAKRDAAILNKGLVPIFDILLGGGIVKGAGKLKGVIFKGNGAGIIRAGEASGVLDEGANVAKGPPKIEMGGGGAPQGMANAEVAELTRKGNYLENVEGATVVQSSDLGNVYELPNLGGVPETTLEAKAGILKSLEMEYFEKTGLELHLAEVLKPSSALRKVGGVAKTELTAAKTGKAAMLDAGAPKDVLAEANVWTGPDPRTLAGFDDLPKMRQQAAVKEWEKAQKSWDAYHNPAAGSKEERLRQVVGQEARVPLDVAPNESGLQRFVTAHYEEVHVVEGQAEAKLIRVKKYEIEVVDTTRNNQVVNRKTVVDLPEAAPQTPDADAVGMAKVTGRDSAGRPILEPLNRAEREFVMQRYIDKNIKARRLPPGTRGAINDLAEHGATLVMDDAPAKAAGKLLPMFGVPFLPGGVGRAYLKRIAPFVAAKNATPAQVNAMYRQMVALVNSEGGFAQHAVVVTSDSRYLGDIPFASW
ncbi:MAG TPA: hypothetical protein VEU29_07900 [Actinomycetota bacterium]|nr:hypothetical protein [Actinomycetota bacterium]